MGVGLEPRRRAPRRARAPNVRSRSGPSRCRRCSCRPTDIRTRSADIAWRKLVLNSAHDSSCACSSDEVVDQVLVRYYEARQIGDGLTHDAVAALAGQVGAPAGATVVVNPTARTRSGLVDARDPGTRPVSLRRARRHAPPRPARRRGRRRRFPDDGHGPEDPLGARPDARHRVRGPPDPRLRHDDRSRCTTSARHRAARSPRCRRARRPRGVEGGDAGARRGRAHDACRAAGGPRPQRVVRHRRDRRLRLVVLHRGRGARVRKPRRSRSITTGRR